jgi:serine-type D-Ala-D-Ala carboxypeptidase/endopeptidase (penicillin-binding protein 4)
VAGRWARAAAALLCASLLAGCTTVDEPSGPDPTPGQSAGPPPPSRAETPAPDAEPVPRDTARQDVAEAVEETKESPPVDRDDLVARVDALIAAAVGELSEAELGVAVTDPEGRVVAARGADRAMLPASTLKLVTAAAILRTLGPEARLRTSVEATAPIGGDGVLRGDLYLSGTGDPVLATADYGRWVHPARPRTPMEDLADQLVDAGLRRVRGDVVGHADGYVGPTTAEGWLDSYFSDFDARHISGVTADAGIESRFRWPGGEVPDPDDDETPPRRVRLEVAEDPGRNAALLLVRLLQQRGVRIDGRAAAREPDRPIVGRLAQVESPPMTELLRFMVQRSDNHLADTLFHAAGRVRTGEGSWAGGERAAMQVLDHLGVDRAGVRMADGSGLSRDDRLTALALVELDRAMSDGRHGEVWRTLMAVAGESGTMSTRLRGTPAQGRTFAKTGSLRDVSSLSGFVRNEAGERHHFAIIANRASGADRAVVRAFADDLALLLTADLEGCTVRSGSRRDRGPLGRPPVQVAC